MLQISIIVAAILVADPVSMAWGEEAPSGWVEIAPPKSEEEWSCANRSGDAWRVEAAALNKGIRIVPETSARSAIALQLPDGRLVGTNRGEFGGTVEWESAKTKQRTLILRDNPVSFVRSAHGLFVLVGLSHLGVSEGKLIELVRQGESWAQRSGLNLGAAPAAAVLRDQKMLYIATSSGLVEANLEARQVAQVWRNERWGYLHPKSIVRTESGTIFVGMRHAVARVTRMGPEYVERWWVPASCPRLRPGSQPFKCECTNS